jgi:hypothetical protein
MHGAAAATVLELECSFDLYDGVIVDADALPTSSEGFAVRLTASLASWREAKRRGVWLKVRRVCTRVRKHWDVDRVAKDGST